MRKFNLLTYCLHIGILSALLFIVSCGDDDEVMDQDMEQENVIIANAGIDQTVSVGELVTLDGSSTNDTQGNSLVYTWAFTSVPSGSALTVLSESTTESPTFTPDVAGTYVISLSVTDGTVSDTDDVEIIAESDETITIIESNIIENITLENQNGSGADYLIRGFLDIDADLIIEPGVTLLFDNNSGFRITSEGTIFAEGTEADSIIFTSDSEIPGSWKGLLFVDSENNINELSYCRISYAGETEFSSTIGKGAIGIGYFLNPSKVKLNNSLIRDSDGKGLTMDYRAQGRFGEFSSNRFSGNTDLAMSINVIAAGDIDGNTIIENNGIDAIEIFDPSSEEITENASWARLANDIPYYINGDIDVGAELTLAAGITLAFDNDKYMRVLEDGALIAAGTSTDRILFTGINKTKGAWRGLYFRDSDNVLNELTYVTFEYGGSTEISSTIEKANIGFDYFLGTNEVKLNNVISRESDGYGLSVDYRSETEFSSFSENEFSNNELAGLRINPKQIQYLDAMTTYDDNNGNDFIEVYHSSSFEELTESTLSWINTGVEILIDCELHINGDLTIQPGVTLVFENNSGLRINGSLSAIGTSEEHILMTGKTKAAGAWKGLYFYNTTSPLNELDYVDIEFGGQTEFGVEEANLNLRGFLTSSLVTLEITNSSFTNSAGYGIAKTSGVSLSPANFETINTFSDNANGNVFTQ